MKGERIPTVRDVILAAGIELPAFVWDGNVQAPLFFDDPFELHFWYQKTKRSKERHFTIALIAKEIKEG